MTTIVGLWVIGWLVTVGFMTASKHFMSEVLWWRVLHLVLALINWPVTMGAQLHRALLPAETVED